MFRDYQIKRIQLLPMSDREDDNGFEDEEEVREFLDRELAENDGIYGYNERGIDLEDTDALILFQFHNNVMGYGVYQTRNREEKYYKFYADTIYNTEKITADELRKVVPDFTHFSRVKQIIDMQYLGAILLLLQKKKKSYYRNKNMANKTVKKKV